MIAGASEARWVRPQPRRTIPAGFIDRVLREAFPRSGLLNLQPLTDGLRNANFKLQLDAAPNLVVLRIYEHDPSLCQKEIDLIQLVAGSIPVPEALYADARPSESMPPFALSRWVEGISFREILRSGDARVIASAANAAGQTLAALGHFPFPNLGWLAPGPKVVQDAVQVGANPIPRFVDFCLASPNLQRRTTVELRDRIGALVWSWSPQLAAAHHEARLVHGDFGKRNLLMSSVGGNWPVAAVLDWEFAVSGSPLADLATSCDTRSLRVQSLNRISRRRIYRLEGRCPTDGANSPGCWICPFCARA